MKLKIVFLLLLASSADASVPKKYFNCPGSAKIISPPNSQGFFLDQDCKNVYVKPPIEGSLKLSGYVPALSAQECKAEVGLLDMINRSIATNETAQKDLNKAYKNLEKKYQKIANLKKQCRGPEAATQKIQIVLDKLNSQKEFLNEKLSLLEESMTDCTDDGSSNDCSIIEQKKLSLMAEIKEIDSEARQVRSDLREAEIDFKSCKLRVDAELRYAQQDDVDYSAAVQQLFSEREKLIGILRRNAESLMKEVGGQLVVGLYSGHNQLVEDFKKLNGEDKFLFHPMILRNAILHFEKINDGLKGGFPVQLRNNILGLRAPNDEGEITPEMLSEDFGNAEVVFGEGAAGHIIINKYTACTISQRLSSASEEAVLQEIANTLKPTVTFGYELQVSRDVKIKYNESHLYQLIKKSSSSSGLFRSSSSTSVTEKSEAEKWIQIEVSSEDERLKFENSEKLMMDIRREFLDAALMNVAKSYITGQQAELRDPGPDGATKSANELKNNCPHAYCQAAAVVLNIGSALFSGSESEANMTRIVKAQQEEHLKDTQTIKEFGQQTLKIFRE